MAQIDQLQTEQDLLAFSLINNRDQNGQVYFLKGSLALYLQMLNAKIHEHPDVINGLLTKKYEAYKGLTFSNIVEECCGEFDPHTKQLKQLSNTADMQHDNSTTMSM